MDPFRLNALLYQARHLSKKRNVWRFNYRDRVFVYGWKQDEPVVVIEQRTDAPWPQYLVKEQNGDTWIISQLLLSSKPIPQRSELVETDD